MISKTKKNPHPGVILEEKFLKPKKLTQMRLAAHLGWSHAKINELIRGKRGVTPAIALHLADAFGTTPDYWMNLQCQYDLELAAKTHKKVPKLKTS